MNELLCQLDKVAQFLVMVYTGVLVVYALASWIPDLRGRWLDYLGMLVEPVLQPLRRIIPPIGGVDIAYLVLFIILQVVVRGAVSAVACY